MRGPSIRQSLDDVAYMRGAEPVYVYGREQPNGAMNMRGQRDTTEHSQQWQQPVTAHAASMACCMACSCSIIRSSVVVDYTLSAA